MKVLFAASEAMPFIKSGGLGDVAGALPGELKKLKVDARLVIPFYSGIPASLREEATLIKEFTVPLAWRHQYCGVYRIVIDGLTCYLIDNEYYFKRKGTYGQYDDGERFAFFSMACLEMIRHLDFLPDIIHCNDWHTGLIPVYLRIFYQDDPMYGGIKTMFTIHNIEYQGIYGRDTLYDVFGIPDKHAHHLEYNQTYNVMKGALQTSDAITTVSRTYAEEILHPFYANRLEHILKENAWKIKGIINGIDTRTYDPATDKHLFAPYDKENPAGKAKNKAGLQKLFCLPETPDIPLLAMITRLTGHKGIDLVNTVVEQILSTDIQMVVLGQGEWLYETRFKDLEKKYPTKFKAAITFSPDLASQIYAGADMFLMPSRSEPCGLAQMIAMRYGTVPIVRETGGLKDTVAPYNPKTKKGNGFTFFSYDAYDMMDAVKRALALYKDKENWQAVMQNAFSSDSSWKSSAKEYKKAYTDLFKKQER